MQTFKNKNRYVNDEVSLCLIKHLTVMIYAS
jgi:hypothetical protein